MSTASGIPGPWAHPRPESLGAKVRRLEAETQRLRDALGQVGALVGDHLDVHACADCGLPTCYAIGSHWLAPDDLWARVVGGNGVVLCPSCFHARAQTIGVSVSWRAVEDSAVSGEERPSA